VIPPLVSRPNGTVGAAIFDNPRRGGETDLGSKAMKILMVGDAYPWPPTTGSHLRMENAARALSELGEIDLFCFYDARQPQDPIPPDLGLERVCLLPLGPTGDTPPRRFASLVRRDLPLEVALRNGNKNPRHVFESWRASSYDLAWFSSATGYQWLGRPRVGPTVVDICDLADVKERQRADLIAQRPAPDLLSRLRRAGALVQARVNAHDWSRFQRSVASEVERVVLASEADLPLFAVDNCDVVLNTYRAPDHPVGHDTPRRPPTLLFQGTFDYGPNVDGAHWLVEELAPAIRAQRPELRIRLVGKTAGRVERLADPPLVTVVGRVPRMEPELAEADLVVVPLRMGSGTRFKILEAFAHRVPVVSTPLGAEGLAAVDGVHLLLADQPGAVASACARLCNDLDFRRSLVDAAERLFEERYESRVARDAIQKIVASLTTSGRTSSASTRPPADG
jgi:glycosyltransferase involved in cell wall biosynthesis